MARCKYCGNDTNNSYTYDEMVSVKSHNLAKVIELKDTIYALRREVSKLQYRIKTGTKDE
jgi:hypothetical protein